ncbi:hypothetical protein NKR23_g8778 [Pleurostoma richardsiae]|uniref:Uncharacterized protein n=1 Tax=Pleurostoma richardsiae TaxID=41990 RepID=A0AA38RI08_9PEZI|nr:hypothetical protein NKR23_g8778 [Pleurostoma richardsiae]
MARQFVSLLPLLPALLLSAPAAAQSTSVVSLLLPGFDSQTILASVISVEATATQYFIACPTDEDASECGIGPGATLVEGPSTYELHMTETGVFTADVSCAIASDTAVCTSSLNEATLDASSIDADATGGVQTVTDLSSYTIPVTITAGLDKLSSGSGASETTSSGTAASTGASGSGSSVRPTETVGSAAATGSLAAASSSQSTGGVPRATQNAMLAGVAAVVGGVMMI